MPAAFHEVLFPLDVSLASRGGPVRRTDIVVTGAGREERNSRWAHARRRYDAGGAVRSLATLAAIVAFFEERRGRLIGFRWRDRLDDRSCPPGRDPAPGDQRLATGDGQRLVFPLVKAYGEGASAYLRPIAKPVGTSLRVAVAGIEQAVGRDFDVDAVSGLVTFRAGRAPPAGAAVTAGFLFHVPVRFDTDELSVDLAAFAAGEIVSIPLIEIIP